MIELSNLTVKAGSNEIIHGLNLKIQGVHALIGPNGSGKSSLANVIMGNPEYETKGVIKFNGKDITRLEPWERARLGIFMLFQHPPDVDGVKLSMITKDYKGMASKFMDREINKGLSGGEKKITELVQGMARKPKFWIIDEIDSGLDVENMKKLVEVLKREMKEGLVITHRKEILEAIKPEQVHVIMDGKIICSGSWKKIWNVVKKYGFKKCKLCAGKR